jgi:hypothetical protein
MALTLALSRRARGPETIRRWGRKAAKNGLSQRDKGRTDCGAAFQSSRRDEELFHAVRFPSTEDAGLAALPFRIPIHRYLTNR